MVTAAKYFQVEMFSSETILTTTPKLLKKVLYFLPLSGILTRWGLKWNKGSESKETI